MLIVMMILLVSIFQTFKMFGLLIEMKVCLFKYYHQQTMITQLYEIDPAEGVVISWKQEEITEKREVDQWSGRGGFGIPRRFLFSH